VLERHLQTEVEEVQSVHRMHVLLAWRGVEVSEKRFN
jgi:hypothetical protein